MNVQPYTRSLLKLDIS